MSVDDIISQIPTLARGITISGGEPQDQLDELILLLIKIPSHIDVILFTGKDQVDNRLKGLIDLAIVGPYKRDLPSDKPLLSSSNQRYEFYSDKIAKSELGKQSIGIKVTPEGITFSGFYGGLNEEQN